MEEHQYKYMFEAEDRHWWYVGNHEIFLELLWRKQILKNSTKILDAGCGTGKWLEILKKQTGINAYGIDNNPLAIHYASKRGLKKLQQADVSTFTSACVFDVITSFDVICSNHVNTNDAVKNFRNLLKQNGHLLITVPAYRFMLSRHDKVVHQSKRFRKKQVRTLLESNGFEIIKISYGICLLFPFAFVRRMFYKVIKSNNSEHNEVKVPGRFINFTFLLIMRVEKFFLKYFSLPFGLSVMALAKRK